MTRQTSTINSPRTARSDAGHPMQSPYTAAIRAVAALAAEGAIPTAFPKCASVPATPPEPAGGLAVDEEDESWTLSGYPYAA